jgi:predicted glycosyltransferase
LPHGTTGSSRYLAHDDIPKATDDDDISIRTAEEMEKYESLHHQEFAHTHVYDVNLLERVGLDEEVPIILRTINWGKLYDEPRSGRDRTI